MAHGIICLDTNRLVCMTDASMKDGEVQMPAQIPTQDISQLKIGIHHS